MPSSQANVFIVSSLAVISAIALYSAWEDRRRRDELQAELEDAKQEIEDLLLTQEGTTTTTSVTKTAKRSATKRIIKDDLDDQDGNLSVKAIGTVHSIYRLCVGTPRQGLLAPMSRGRIDLTNLGDSSAADSAIGLEGYSHIWVLFVFHLNTTSSRQDQKNRTKTKVAPPALGGEKVGILATRTPHRFNPIGITLCKLDRIEHQLEQQSSTGVKLFVSGLDLVDGTPVLDVKPYVPLYDSVGFGASNGSTAQVPPWVEGGLSTWRKVDVSVTAKEELRTLLEKNQNALEFYGPNHGEQSVDQTLAIVLDCIQQVLAIDVRSSWQTKKAREGKFQAERAGRLQNHQVVPENDNAAKPSMEGTCTQQLDNLLLHYTVVEADSRKRSPSENSGAEDIVTVQSIQLFTPQDTEKAQVPSMEKMAPSSGRSIRSHNQNDGEPAKVKHQTTAFPVLKPAKVSPNKPSTRLSVQAPPEIESDYSSLKSFWNQVASENTPEGINPSNSSQPQPPDRKVFQFSDKEYPINRQSSSELHARSFGSNQEETAAQATNTINQGKSIAAADFEVSHEFSREEGHKVEVSKKTIGAAQSTTDTANATFTKPTNNENMGASIEIAKEDVPFKPHNEEIGGFRVARKVEDTPGVSKVEGFRVATKGTHSDDEAGDVSALKVTKNESSPTEFQVDKDGIRVAKTEAPATDNHSSTTDVGGLRVAVKTATPARITEESDKNGAPDNVATKEEVETLKKTTAIDDEQRTPEDAVLKVEEDTIVSTKSVDEWVKVEQDDTLRIAEEQRRFEENAPNNEEEELKAKAKRLSMEKVAGETMLKTEAEAKRLEEEETTEKARIKAETEAKRLAAEEEARLKAETDAKQTVATAVEQDTFNVGGNISLKAMETDVVAGGEASTQDNEVEDATPKVEEEAGSEIGKDIVESSMLANGEDSKGHDFKEDSSSVVQLQQEEKQTSSNEVAEKELSALKLSLEDDSKNDCSDPLGDKLAEHKTQNDQPSEASEIVTKEDEPKKGSKAQKWKERMAKAKQQRKSVTESTTADQDARVSCSVCGVEKEKAQFSKSQLKRGSNKCKDCVSQIEG